MRALRSAVRAATAALSSARLKKRVLRNRASTQRGRDRAKVAELRSRGAVLYPEDLGIDRRDANRSLLAARSIKGLVRWSGGLYRPPTRFRNW